MPQVNYCWWLWRATTVENLQVLCASCNRDKGANLA